MRHDPKIPTRKRNVTATPSQSSKVATLSACKKWRPTRRPSGKRQPLAGLPFVPKEKGRGQTRQLCYGKENPTENPFLMERGATDRQLRERLRASPKGLRPSPRKIKIFSKKCLTTPVVCAIIKTLQGGSEGDRGGAGTQVRVRPRNTLSRLVKHGATHRRGHGQRGSPLK